MANYTYGRVHAVTLEVTLRAPSNAVELEKAVTAAWQMYITEHGRDPSDDAITVDARDDLIVLSFRCKDCPCAAGGS